MITKLLTIAVDLFIHTVKAVHWCYTILSLLDQLCHLIHHFDVTIEIKLCLLCRFNDLFVEERGQEVYLVVHADSMIFLEHALVLIVEVIDQVITIADVIDLKYRTNKTLSVIMD